MGKVRLLVLGNGAAGAEKQAFALSARLRTHLIRAGALEPSASDAVQFVRVPLKPGAIFQKLPPALQLVGSRATRDPFFGYAVTEEQKRSLLGEDDGKGPSKRVVIGCGRTTVALCAALKQRSNTIFNIQIQHPRVGLELFDAVITPHHDFHGKSRPANLHLTYGTVLSIDHDLLRREGDKWQNKLRVYATKKTCIAWLIGGPCRGYDFSERIAEDMVDQVLHFVTQHRPHVSLLVTFSRRTPLQVQNVIRTRLKNELNGADEVYLWDGSGANPFNAMLHHATAIVTTPDSVSMTTEAIATGKLVFIVCMDRVSGKFQRFHNTLLQMGFTNVLSRDSHRAVPIITKPSLCGREAIERELETIAATLTAQILQE